MRLRLGRVPLALLLAAMVALLLSACGPLPELICTYDTIETCERAASAALDVVGDRSGVTSVTIRPPDGMWRREGARYLALAMVPPG